MVGAGEGGGGKQIFTYKAHADGNNWPLIFFSILGNVFLFHLSIKAMQGKYERWPT